MTLLAWIMLVGWIPAVLPLFAILPPRRAVVVAYLSAWLFLPNVGISLPGLPDLTKVSATSVGIILGSLLFDGGRIAAFRLRWFDLPMLCYTVCPFFSSMMNGLGPYDGLSATLAATITWWLPYFIGRLYLSDLDGMRALAVGIVIGGLIYVPFCLWEMRMSPQLQVFLYGTKWLINTVRFGGYRPVVFMADGLEVGMWMTAASLAGIWMWKAGSLKQIVGHPFGLPLIALVVTTILCKSSGALGLLFLGVGILWVMVRIRSPIPMILLMAMTLGYLGGRSTGSWTGKDLVRFIETQFDADRAQSLDFRFDNENVLIQKTLVRPVFGWGGWGRARVYDEDGRDITITDGLWIIVFGNTGLFGLASLYGAFLLPLALMVWRFPARLWAHPAVAPAAALAVLVGLYAIDCLLNAMVNPIYILAIGGLTGLGGSLSGRQDEISLEARRDGISEAIPPVAKSEIDTELERREAIAAMEGASDPNPEAIRALAVAYDGLARFLKDDGRISDADAAWERSYALWSAIAATNRGEIEVLRPWADGLNDLAWLLANTSETSRRDPARAVALAEQATALRPDCATYWNTLGLACLRHHDADACILAIETSIRLEGGSIHDHLILSMAYQRGGDPAIARRWFASAIARMQASEAITLDVAALYEEAEALLNAPRDVAALPAPTKPLSP